jgi:hypothetical protein
MANSLILNDFIWWHPWKWSQMTIYVTIATSLMPATGSSPMVSREQFHGMRVQIILAGAVRLIKEVHVVIDAGKGDAEGATPLAIGNDDCLQLLFGFKGKIFFCNLTGCAAGTGYVSPAWP